MYVGSFKSNKTPAFVFSGNLSFKLIGDAASHESGHTLNLRHDGASRPQNCTTRGTAPGGRSWGTATRVSSPSGRRASTQAPTTPKTICRCRGKPRIPVRRPRRQNVDRDDTRRVRETSGFVGAADPVDVFTIEVLSGGIDARVKPVTTVSNLFVSVTIRDDGGAVVATDTPTAVVASGLAGNGRRPIDWAAHATADVPDGRYTVEIRPAGLGTPSTGFSAYGSHGAYRLAVAIGARIHHRRRRSRVRSGSPRSSQYDSPTRDPGRAEASVSVPTACSSCRSPGRRTSPPT